MSNSLERIGEAEYRDADSFNFRHSWEGVKHACRQYRWLIVLVCMLTVGMTALYVKIWPPVYIATVKLVGESHQDVSRGTFYQTWNVFRNDQLTDEVHVITSTPVLVEVIRRLNLTDDDMYHSFFNYAGLLWTRSPVGRLYREVKERFFPPETGRFQPTREQMEAARTLVDFKSGVGLERVMETNLGNLTVRGPTMQVAEIANNIVQVYFEQRRARHYAEANAAYEALEAELVKARTEVTGIEARMRQYYSDNQLLLTFEKDKIDIGQAQALKASISELTAAIAANEEALKQVETELEAEERYVVSARVVQANPLRDGLRTRVVEMTIARQQALLHYRPDAPEIAEIDRKLAIINAQMGKEPATSLQQNTTVMSSRYEELRGRAAQLRTELAGQRAGMAVKKATLLQGEELLTTIPEKMRMVHDLERDHAAAEKKFSTLQEKLMIAVVSRASALAETDSIRVVESAGAPTEVAWPRTKLLLGAALALGAIAGVGLALLMDLFFGRVHRFRLANGDLQIYATVQRERLRAADLFASSRAPDGAVRMLRRD